MFFVVSFGSVCGSVFCRIFRYVKRALPPPERTVSAARVGCNNCKHRESSEFCVDQCLERWLHAFVEGNIGVFAT